MLVAVSGTSVCLTIGGGISGPGSAGGLDRDGVLDCIVERAQLKGNLLVVVDVRLTRELFFAALVDLVSARSMLGVWLWFAPSPGRAAFLGNMEVQARLRADSGKE